MTCPKRVLHTHHSPVKLASRIYAHAPPLRNRRRYLRDFLKPKYGAESYDLEDNPDDTYLSFLRGLRDTVNDDDAGSDGTDLDASNDDEDLDEETTLIEMLGSSYSNPSSPHSTRVFLIRGLTVYTEKKSFRHSGACLRTLHTAYVRMLS